MRSAACRMAAASGGFLGRLLGGGRKAPAHAPGYAFLSAIPGWTAEQVCLAYALTEPSLTSVLIHPRSVEALEQLAAVTDRDLPSQLPAQIEMARFAAQSSAA